MNLQYVRVACDKSKGRAKCEVIHVAAVHTRKMRTCSTDVHIAAVNMLLHCTLKMVGAGEHQGPLLERSH